jgi:hypothetical protein
MRTAHWRIVLMLCATCLGIGVLAPVEAQPKQYFGPMPEAGAFLKGKNWEEYLACPVMVSKDVIAGKGAIYAAVQVQEPAKIMVHRLDKFGDAKRNWEVKVSANEPIVTQVGNWSDFSEPGSYYFVFEMPRGTSSRAIAWAQISGAKDPQSVIKFFKPNPRMGRKFDLSFELIRNSEIVMEVIGEPTPLAKGPRNAGQEHTEQWDAAMKQVKTYTVTLEATPPNQPPASRTVMVSVK